jgi:hypothetical protein
VSIENSQTCIKRPVPLNVMLVMDVSGSMDDASDTTREAFATMSQALQSISLPSLPRAIKEVRFGLVTFEDTIIFQAPAMTDQAQIQANIAQNFKAVERGTDGTEGALLALDTALQLAKSATPASGAVNAVVLVTDAYGHDGSGGDHHRSGSTAAIDALLADKAFSSFLLFTAVPSHGGNGRGDFDDATGDLPSAEAQYVAIRQHWQQAHAAAMQPVGAHLADELKDGNVLSSLLPQMLASMLKPCTAN